MNNAAALDDSFAFLAPEIVHDVIDQIAGRKRFTCDHLALSVLEGTWGDFFRGAGSVIFIDSYCNIKRRVCSNGEEVKTVLNTKNLPENVHFYVDLAFKSINDDPNVNLLCQLAHRLYGRHLVVKCELSSETKENKVVMAKVKRALDGFRPRFEGIALDFRETGEIPQIYLDFAARMLQSKFLRFFYIDKWNLARWNVKDLENQLLSFCRSDQFEFFGSFDFSTYSEEFVSAAYEALRSKKCPLDLKPRCVNVNIEKRTAKRLAEKFEMVPIIGVVQDKKRNSKLVYWAQEQSVATPEMSVELLIVMRFDQRHYLLSRDHVWKAVVVLQKANNKSVEEEYQNEPDKAGSYCMEHGVESPAEVPFRMRTLNAAMCSQKAILHILQSLTRAGAGCAQFRLKQFA